MASPGPLRGLAEGSARFEVSRMKILAIDTALLAISACVLDDGADSPEAIETIAMERGHAEALLPLIDRVMARVAGGFASLARVAVTVGPGSFTGLRAGIAAARAIGIACRISGHRGFDPSGPSRAPDSGAKARSRRRRDRCAPGQCLLCRFRTGRKGRPGASDRFGTRGGARAWRGSGATRRIGCAAARNRGSSGRDRDLDRPRKYWIRHCFCS